MLTCVINFSLTYKSDITKNSSLTNLPCLLPVAFFDSFYFVNFFLHFFYGSFCLSIGERRSCCPLIFFGLKPIAVDFIVVDVIVLSMQLRSRNAKKKVQSQ